MGKQHHGAHAAFSMRTLLDAARVDIASFFFQETLSRSQGDTNSQLEDKNKQQWSTFLSCERASGSFSVLLCGAGVCSTVKKRKEKKKVPL